MGSSVKGLVLDLSDGVVSLSLKPELISSVRIGGTKKVGCTFDAKFSVWLGIACT